MSKLEDISPKNGKFHLCNGGTTCWQRLLVLCWQHVGLNEMGNH